MSADDVGGDMARPRLAVVRWLVLAAVVVVSVVVNLNNVGPRNCGDLDQEPEVVIYEGGPPWFDDDGWVKMHC